MIVEGYTDVMAMHLAGVKTAVAACGTAFGDEHLALLRRLLMDDSFFRGEVIYTFDGDDAGRAAAMKRSRAIRKPPRRPTSRSPPRAWTRASCGSSRATVRCATSWPAAPRCSSSS